VSLLVCRLVWCVYLPSGLGLQGRHTATPRRPGVTMDNPFTKRREKKEAQVRERGMQQEQPLGMPQEQVMMPPSAMAQMQVESSDGQGQDPYASEDFDKYLPQSAQVDQQTPTWEGGRSTYEPPSRARQCVSKLQSGFMIGASLGGAFGFLYGTYAAIKFKHVLYLPIAVVQAGGAFGFFLACGTVIRCEEKPEYQLDPAGICSSPLELETARASLERSPEHAKSV